MSLCQDPLELSDQFISTLERFCDFEIFQTMILGELGPFQKQVASSLKLIKSIAMNYEDQIFDLKYSLSTLNLLHIGMKISIGLFNLNEVP